MPDIITRPSRESDGRAVGEISYRSHTISFGEFTSERFVDEQDLEEHTSWWKQFLAPTESGLRMFVAERGDELIGFSMFGPLNDRYSFYEASRSLGDEAQTAVVYSIHVDPDHLGSGAGRLLMKSSLDHMGEQGFRTVVLDTFEANTRARRFYETGGWQAAAIDHSDEEGPIVIYSLSIA